MREPNGRPGDGRSSTDVFGRQDDARRVIEGLCVLADRRMALRQAERLRLTGACLRGPLLPLRAMENSRHRFGHRSPSFVAIAFPSADFNPPSPPATITEVSS